MPFFYNTCINFHQTQGYPETDPISQGTQYLASIVSRQLLEHLALDISLWTRTYSGRRISVLLPVVTHRRASRSSLFNIVIQCSIGPPSGFRLSLTLHTSLASFLAILYLTRSSHMRAAFWPTWVEHFIIYHSSVITASSCAALLMASSTSISPDMDVPLTSNSLSQSQTVDILKPHA